ncbi:MAG TPA: RlmE family RNA methyltransferase [Stellaceae bacterium]|jgi:23S rRNA (uridine2552-2'-O)-methyltransferase|nr:RlmE family RNA methyltransferase [Stellaceae bacterium]
MAARKQSHGARRGMVVRVKTAKKRSVSSAAWLARQLNDPYVAEAKRLGYRSRAAFKLIELDERFHLLKRNARIVDLGAAPGGWTQIAAQKIDAEGGKGKLVAADILPMEAIPGAIVLQQDFLDEKAPAEIIAALGGQADLVLSDMAAPTTGHAQTDHLRIVALAEAAYEFAKEVLAPGGAFVAKVFQGGAEGELFASLKRDFTTLRHAKPPASRAESAEVYVVAQGYRGTNRAANNADSQG